MARLDRLALQAQWIFDRAAWKKLGRRLLLRVIAIIAFGIFFGATAFYYRIEIFHFLIAPANGRLSPFAGLPVFFNPLTALGQTFGIAGKAATVGAYPVALYSVYTLFTPVVPQRVRLFYRIFAPLSMVAAVAGAAFAYYIIFPRMLHFLLDFSNEVAVPLIALDLYLDFLFKMVWAMALVFQIPLVMYLLTKTGVVSYQRFRHSRKWLIIFASVLAGFLTPTFDFINWAWMAVPTYLIFEVGLFASWLARPDRGNYLFIRSVYEGAAWTLRRPAVLYRKVRFW